MTGVRLRENKAYIIAFPSAVGIGSTQFVVHNDQGKENSYGSAPIGHPAAMFLQRAIGYVRI